MVTLIVNTVWIRICRIILNSRKTASKFTTKSTKGTEVVGTKTGY